MVVGSDAYPQSCLFFYSAGNFWVGALPKGEDDISDADRMHV